MPKLADAGIYRYQPRPEDEGLELFEASDVQGHALKIHRIMYAGLNKEKKPCLLVRFTDTSTGEVGKLFIPGDYTKGDVVQFFKNRPKDYSEDEWTLDCVLVKIDRPNNREMWVINDPGSDHRQLTTAGAATGFSATPDDTENIPF